MSNQSVGYLAPPLDNFMDPKTAMAMVEAGYNEMSQEEKDALEYQFSILSYLKIMGEIESYAQAEDWEKVCELIRTVTFVMEEAFDTYYEQIPDDMKYNFVTELYTHHGDHYDNIREALIHARDYGTPVLPDGMSGVITVYRGCCESMEDAPKSISWTTDKAVAEFFAKRKCIRGEGDVHVYEGKIRVEDIIFYTDDREEREVMQYDKVFDVRELPFEDSAD